MTDLGATTLLLCSTDPSHPPLPNATVGYNRRVSPFITRSPDVENESIIFIGSHCPLLSLAPPPPPPTSPLLGEGGGIVREEGKSGGEKMRGKRVRK